MPPTCTNALCGSWLLCSCRWWFNTCVKVFVGLFSYINFLPIPWRLSCLWHVYCSRRPCHPGVDFYGRPTNALWFHLTVRTRQHISLGLNLAWVFHFVALATHLLFAEYIDSQYFPGVLYRNLPMVLSMLLQIGAATAQDKAERVLIRQYPDRFPPKPLDLVLAGWRKWHSGQEQGRLIDVIRKQFDEVRGSCLTNPIEDA